MICQLLRFAGVTWVWLGCQAVSATGVTAVLVGSAASVMTVLVGVVAVLVGVMQVSSQCLTFIKGCFDLY